MPRRERPVDVLSRHDIMHDIVEPDTVVPHESMVLPWSYFQSNGNVVFLSESTHPRNHDICDDIVVDQFHQCYQPVTWSSFAREY